MLELLRDEQEIRRHVTDAMIAAQLEPYDDARWLASCERWKARDQRSAMGSITR